jgi:hypothetical protein
MTIALRSLNPAQERERRVEVDRGCPFPVESWMMPLFSAK